MYRISSVLLRVNGRLTFIERDIDERIIQVLWLSYNGGGGTSDRSIVSHSAVRSIVYLYYGIRRPEGPESGQKGELKGVSCSHVIHV